MVIRVFKTSAAVREVKKIAKKIAPEDIDGILIAGWYVDLSPSCYLLYENNVLKSFALVTKCRFDPMGLQSQPHVLNYIYTLRDFRREGHAAELVAFVKGAVQFSCFCSSPESVALFEKAGCSNHGVYNNTVLLRHP